MENIEQKTEKEIIEWALANRNAIRNLVFVYAWNQDMLDNEGSPLTTKAKDWYKENKDKPWFDENNGVIRLDSHIMEVLFPYFKARFEGVMEDVMDKAITYFSQFMILGFTDEMSRTCAYDCARYLCLKKSRLTKVGQLLEIATTPYADLNGDAEFVLDVMDIAEPGFERLNNIALKASFYGEICDAYMTLDMFEEANKYCDAGRQLVDYIHDVNSEVVFYARKTAILSKLLKFKEAYELLEEELEKIEKDQVNSRFLYRVACGIAYEDNDETRLTRYANKLLEYAGNSDYYRFYGLLFLLSIKRDEKMEEEILEITERLDQLETYAACIELLSQLYLRHHEYEKGIALADRWMDKLKEIDDEDASLVNTLWGYKIQILALQGKDIDDEADKLLSDIETNGDIDKTKQISRIHIC